MTLGNLAAPVYVIHWRAVEWCVETVNSVRASIDVDLRIVVIDNESSGGESLRTQLPSDVRILSLGHNAGYTGAANLAFRDWFGSPNRSLYAAIVSHDLDVDRTSFARLLRDLEADPSIGIVGPSIDFMGFYVNPRVGPGFTPVPAASGVFSCDWISGTCLVIRAECAEQVGDFDESFGSYSEDVDYCLRARDAGWRVAVDSTARASGRGSAHGETAVEQVALNNLRLARKRGGRRALLVGWLRLANHVARTGAGGLRPGRSRSARARSKRATRSRGRALVRALSLFASGAGT